MRDFSALPHQSQVHRWTAETLLWGRLHAEGRTWGLVAGVLGRGRKILLPSILSPMLWEL
jgi:hypothetical protein